MYLTCKSIVVLLAVRVCSLTVASSWLPRYTLRSLLRFRWFVTFLIDLPALVGESVCVFELVVHSSLVELRTQSSELNWDSLSNMS